MTFRRITAALLLALAGFSHAEPRIQVGFSH